MAKKTDKQFLAEWQTYRDNISKATPIDLNETPQEKKKRIERLEKNPEKWFEYYFPNFYTSAPAPWHIAATRRILNNPEWYEVRSWSRELAKSVRTMMEVLFLVLTEQKNNVLLVSNSADNAMRLLLPYKSILEANNRIINDYGTQQSIGNWEADEFITRKKVAFRALGVGQSPRGTRNDADRPNIIIIDDIDTDEKVQNPDRVKKDVQWIENALIPTRSISGHLLLIACGNIIAQYCCITEMAKKADKHEVINIRDKNGKSTWDKNTEAHINRVLSLISYNAAQREYFNNPLIDGDTFEKINYQKAPKIASCDMVVVYFDPSTSNKDKVRSGGKTSASFKSAVIVGFKGLKYYTYWVRVDQTNNAKFIEWIFDADQYLRDHDVDPRTLYIENNSLQDPFYQQVIKPDIAKKAEDENLIHPPLREDHRRKPGKYDRIEATLEPIDRNGNLIFDEKLKGDKHMEIMEGQMLSVSPNAKYMDGPDALEGAVWIMQNRQSRRSTNYRHGARPSRRF